MTGTPGGYADGDYLQVMAKIENAETKLYDHITQGPRSNPKKCLTFHPTVRGECLYLLSGEVIGVEKVVDTADFNRREQSRVHVAGGSFLVKETAEEILEMVGWSVE